LLVSHNGLQAGAGGLSELPVSTRTQVYLLFNVYIPLSARLRLLAVSGSFYLFL
jgi:hypothetical protein